MSSLVRKINYIQLELDNIFNHFSIIHIFEPVPTFNKILTEKWDGHKISNGWDATVNNFGLGSNDR